VPYSNNEVEGRDFHLPVLIFIFTKFRKIPNAKLVRMCLCFAIRKSCSSAVHLSI